MLPQPTANPEKASVYQFISRLIDRNRALLNTSDGSGNEDIKSTLTSLAIAQNALRRLSLLETSQDIPLQLAVMGPTQVGKSTLTNLLLQQEQAESSAEAGFTVHCQGFHLTRNIRNSYSNENHWAKEYFGELQLAALSQLDRQVLGEYSLVEVQSADKTFDNTVIWDTPDFDSIRAFDYRAPLIKTLVLADVIIFVVSKEKYADRTVWHMLELLTSLNIPLVMVMNKTPANIRFELQQSIENKFSSALPGVAMPPVSFIDEYPNGDLTEIIEDEHNQLRQLVSSKLERPPVELLKEQTLGFIRQQWQSWISPVADQHRLQREYQQLVNKTVAATVARYKREYIDSERHREVIQLALSELLVLLEVPGLAGPLSKVRSVVTWPVRTFISNAREPSPVANDDRNEERRLLDELGNHATATLIASVAKHESGPDADWWHSLRIDIAHAEPAIQSAYTTGLDNYQTMLNVEVDRAAQSLYQQLKQQPATLNSLRAARVTADATAVVLAVKSGGLGAIDLVVAPAMLSLTTFLTEGALGKYMDRIQKNLTAYQEKEVRSVIDRKIARPLQSISAIATDNQYISEEDLLLMTEELESGNV